MPDNNDASTHCIAHSDMVSETCPRHKSVNLRFRVVFDCCYFNSPRPSLLVLTFEQISGLQHYKWCVCLFTCGNICALQATVVSYVRNAFANGPATWKADQNDQEW